jgi:hypothetical protein
MKRLKRTCHIEPDHVLLAVNVSLPLLFFSKNYITTKTLTRTLTPMNTCTQTLPQWVLPKDWAPDRSGDSQSHHRYLIFNRNVAYHFTHNTVNPEKIPEKGVRTRIWTLVGSFVLNRHTIGLQANSRLPSLLRHGLVGDGLWVEPCDIDDSFCNMFLWFFENI